MTGYGENILRQTPSGDIGKRKAHCKETQVQGPTRLVRPEHGKEAGGWRVLELGRDRAGTGPAKWQGRGEEYRALNAAGATVCGLKQGDDRLRFVLQSYPEGFVESKCLKGRRRCKSHTCKDRYMKWSQEHVEIKGNSNELFYVSAFLAPSPSF